LARRIGKRATGGGPRVLCAKWRATADDDGHYSLAIPL
jgi:hypothetical protein